METLQHAASNKEWLDDEHILIDSSTWRLKLNFMDCQEKTQEQNFGHC